MTFAKAQSSFLPHSMAMFLMHVNHFLYFIVTAHKDTRSIMDVLRDNSKHTFHTAIDRLTSGYFDHVSIQDINH